MKQPDYVIKQKNLLNQLSLPTPCRHLYMGTGSITKVEVSKDNTDLILMCSFGNQKVGFLYSEIQRAKAHPLQFSSSQAKLYSQLLTTLSTPAAKQKEAAQIKIEDSNSAVEVKSEMSVTEVSQTIKKQRSKKYKDESTSEINEETSNEIFEAASDTVELIETIDTSEANDTEIVESDVTQLESTNADY